MTDPNAQKPTREAIGARLRYDVLRRCNFACYYCGIPASLGLKQLHIDHVTPVSLGGTNDPWNLVAACWDCNSGKTNTVPSIELVHRVIEDWETYTSPLDPTANVQVCRWCGRGILAIEDEDYDECDSCSQNRWYGYTAGISHAFADPERAANVIRRGEGQ